MIPALVVCDLGKVGKTLPLVAAALVGAVPEVAETPLGEAHGQRFGIYHRGDKVQIETQ
jgi:hypothetical protein